MLKINLIFMKKYYKIYKMMNIQTVISFVFLVLIMFGCVDEDSTIVTPSANLPKIVSILPSSATVGDTLTIHGENFNFSQGYGYIDIYDSRGKNTQITSVLAWSDSSVVFIVPEAKSYGSVSASIVIYYNSSNTITYNLISNHNPQIDFVEIPSGSFIMGSDLYEGYDNESPAHSVTLSRSFLMSKYEITQKQWTSLMSFNPSTFKNKIVYSNADNLPISNITWFEAVDFCNKLSDYEGLKRCYSGEAPDIVCDWTANGFRLPTEAEWEYACRGGTTTKFYTGDDEAGLAAAAWYYGNRDTVPHEVGLKLPNTFGLYDMLGNVSEWCWDWWYARFDSSTAADPKGIESGPGRIQRGGTWISSAACCRASFRYYYGEPARAYFFAGLRLVRNMD
ncbi:MAG: hypothetical protein QG635_1792 [Bacteroidota bacterium]|nr:hypothetical protein [Bacteroidota bacterium]